MPTFGISPLSEAADLDQSHAELVLNAAVLTLRAEMPGLEVAGEIIRGKPAQGLLDRSGDAALVVVGNRARTGLSRLVLGSVSTAVVTHADVPVVLVREEADHVADAWREGPVVVGVDGSPGSEAAVTFAMETSLRRGMKVIAMHTLDENVLAVTGSGSSEAGRTATVAQQTRLQELSPALREAREEYPAVQVVEEIRAGRAAEMLTTAGADAAMTVVGSRGHGGFKGMLLGSVSREVIENVQSPVAVVRTPDA